MAWLDIEEPTSEVLNTMRGRKDMKIKRKVEAMKAWFEATISNRKLEISEICCKNNFPTLKAYDVESASD